MERRTMDWKISFINVDLKIVRTRQKGKNADQFWYFNNYVIDEDLEKETTINLH